MRLSLGKVLIVAFGLALVAGVVYGFLPRPIDVDLGVVSKGPLLVTVDEDGKTRIRDKYIVSMPFAGRIERITLDPGDTVSGGESVIATVYPTSPELLNPRSLAEAEARVSAARSGVQRAESAVERAKSDHDWALSTAERIRKLRDEKATTEERYTEAEAVLRSRSSELATMQFAVDIAKFELKQAEAALIRAKPRNESSSDDWQFDVVSPISGKVLRVFQESAATLPMGTQLVEVGDPADLEMEIDVLSQDAVKIQKDAKVYVEHWGGEQPLVGRVQLVEPAGFTKISALGVEEQRVNVIASFSVPASERSTLGDGFRVDARIALWEAEDVLQVPSSALFRVGDGWAVFAADSRGRVHRRVVTVGHRNSQAAQIEGGLEAGEKVVLHPGDNLSDGAHVTARPPAVR